MTRLRNATDASGSDGSSGATGSTTATPTSTPDPNYPAPDAFVTAPGAGGTN